MKDLKEFNYVFNLLKKEKKKLIFFSILYLISTSAYIFSGYLNGRAIDEITKNNINKCLMFFGLYALYIIIFRCILQTFSTNGLAKLEYKLSIKLGFKAYQKALDLPAYAYEEMSSGEIINRITSDSDSLTNTLRNLIQMFSSIIIAFLLIFYIFYNSYIIGIEILFCIILLFIIFKIFNPKMKKIQSDRKKEYDKYTSLTNESIRGIREIKTLGIKNNLISEMRDINKDLYNKSTKGLSYDLKLGVYLRIVRMFLEIGVFVTCAFLIYYKQITLTFFVAMTYYVYNYINLVDILYDLNGTYQRLIVSISRVNELIYNRKYKDEKYGNIKLDKCIGNIEFKNVTFNYPNEEVILNNFNLKLEPHKKIAIVGKSGQGKTTLFNLLTRVFDTNKGEILLDGINIKDLDEESLRKNISIIRQEPFIFNRTIKDNFKIVDKNISLEEIRKYMSLAYLDDYVMNLPDKYDTLLGEGGVNLSGGQKQRLVIARTLIKNTKVILFDEATSALDNNSQEYIKKAIDNLVKDHTIVIVAHRLSTIRDADIIYVVEKGKIVGEGTHSELMKNNKIYKNLYETESFD